MPKRRRRKFARVVRCLIETLWRACRRAGCNTRAVLEALNIERFYGARSVSPRYLVVFAENLDVPVAEFFRESAVDHVADGQNRMRAPAKIDLEILDLLGHVDSPTKIAWRNLLRTIVEA